MNLKHIAIIMDGNGRWAKKRGLRRSAGHREGAKNARRITRAVGNLKVPFLTLYALSTENLYRPQDELDGLISLMRDYLKNEIPTLLENKIRLMVIGDRKYLPADVKKSIDNALEVTSKDYKMTLVLAICYGGRDDVIRAVKQIAKESDVARITEKKIAAALDTCDIPDPDLVIRTGGEYRISNFLTWQSAYSELYFTKSLWPDFSPAHLKRAIAAYERRERRYGRTDETVGDKEQGPSKKMGKLR
jgi:undecaprenyl diphosphate synthase